MFSSRNIVAGIFILLLCLGVGVTFSKIYQPEAKNIKNYKLALTDYENKNYSNSYFLFSKIGALSSLKPSALYRQAMCARKLGDKKSELRSYQQLITYFPNHKLTDDARYYAGQLLIDEDPGLAYRYFDDVSKSDMEEDYIIASESFKARINATKIRYSGKKPSARKKQQIEQAFRTYLEKYPDGRLAANIANTWIKFNEKEISPSDYYLIARAYFRLKMYNEAQNIVNKVKDGDIWAIKALLLYRKRDYKTADKFLLEQIKNNNKILKDDYEKLIDEYTEIYETNKLKYDKLSALLNSAKGNNRDYIWSLKCSYAPEKEKQTCYSSLYSAYPHGEYAKNALFQDLVLSLESKNYGRTRQLCSEYMKKFGDSKEIPMIMFWAAKIDNSSVMLNEIIKKYPDSYYAYRAFWILRNISAATISSHLKFKHVVYPYRLPDRKSPLYSLLLVKDYEMIMKYTNDKFIESWVEYEKGNYATSMIIARDAMAEMEVKPGKSDLRWRLVYPQNYFKQVRKYADEYANNEALIMAILREESSFNTQSQSNAGAMGLMQLMPGTAREIATRSKIPFETLYLLNPEINIKLGNLYYSNLKNLVDKNEVMAVAAYNGGIGSVTNWRNKLSYADIDEFIIQIPYEETQYYIEKIFGSYWNYTRIYQR